MIDKKIILLIGHSSDSQGAYNETNNITEFEFNERLAYYLKEGNDNFEIAYRENGYSALPGEVNKLGGDLILSLHANAFNTEARGCETLYYQNSKQSKKLATIFQKNIVKALETKDRGILSRNKENRGYHILKNTNVPCIILEPFFIDNDSDYDNIMYHYKEIKDSIILSLKEYYS